MRLARRTTQSLLAIAACLLVHEALGDDVYFAFVIGTVIIALMARVWIVTAIALGLVWPLVALAYVMHRTSSRKQAKEFAVRAAASPTGQAAVGVVEDSEHGEYRNQRR